MATLCGWSSLIGYNLVTCLISFALYASFLYVSPTHVWCSVSVLVGGVEQGLPDCDWARVTELKFSTVFALFNVWTIVSIKMFELVSSVVRSNMKSQISLGKSSNKRKTHENLNGKSSSRKMREVQNIAEKIVELKKHKTFVLLKKNVIQFNDINMQVRGRWYRKPLKSYKENDTAKT